MYRAIVVDLLRTALPHAGALLIQRHYRTIHLRIAHAAILSVMHRLVETTLGLWQLFRLGCRTRFRLNSAYWQWRRETAFTSDPAQHPSKSDQRRAILDYARWLHRMQRSTRS